MGGGRWWDGLGLYLCTLINMRRNFGRTLINTKGKIGGGSENHYVKLIINPLFKKGLLWYNALHSEHSFIM